MMRENGVVIEAGNGTVTVEMNTARHSACKTCGMCSTAADGSKMLIEVRTAEALNIGESVTVEIPRPGTALSATILLLAPIVCFMIGLMVGEWLRARGILPGGSGVSVLLGFGSMAVAYAGAVGHDRHLRKSPHHQPRIVEAGED